MTKNNREIQRKLRVLSYAEQLGDVSRACRYFGIGRALTDGRRPFRNRAKRA